MTVWFAFFALVCITPTPKCHATFIFSFCYDTDCWSPTQQEQKTITNDVAFI
eukprot:TRINITY_DN3245_c2_g1_i12.p2 TRINITY_DN3245_c2_g1~~TRINITY_DN3245_c2_g1_i12.p2  ORF type:complete len:52 (+),score=10.70 TRINITY_DN3245_c2_g1_i12:481-636(+)